MTEKWAIDTELGEVLQKNEEQLIDQIAAASSAGVRLQDQGGKPLALRDAHPKAHGCVLAEFRVEDQLPPHLAQGVFVPGKSYPAWIRFSNGFPDAKQPDAKPDVRGMAIKLLGVPGDKVLPEERDAQTQDFILISHPVFFADDVADYLTFTRLMGSGQKLRAVFALGIRGAWNLIKSVSRPASPLEIRYWSMVPYRLGDPPHKQAIKFSVTPCRPATARPSHPQSDFLRETMKKQLEAGEARFDFLVQPRTSTMSVERSLVEWKENQAPFFKVATITIPRQLFSTPERDSFGEQLSFTPWHSLPQHRPLGAVNRIRRVVYDTIAKRRHELNKTPRHEPDANDAEAARAELRKLMSS